MEVVVVEYILSTTSVMDMKRDFHSVSPTMKQDQEHTMMMWEYIADLVCKLAIYYIIYGQQNTIVLMLLIRIVNIIMCLIPIPVITT